MKIHTAIIVSGFLFVTGFCMGTVGSGIECDAATIDSQEYQRLKSKAGGWKKLKEQSDRPQMYYRLAWLEMERLAGE